ncbi:hypothetical protein [Streptomyces sp. NPDC091259]|uniref:hypothetical protein n=1 Tax=Streptomyces sp. NPDC091259 TaxID=3365976 RepID=UPI0038304712
MTRLGGPLRTPAEVTTGEISVTTARQHKTHTARRRLLAATAVTATVAALTAGCIKDGNDNKAAPPSPSPVTSPSLSSSPSVSPADADKAEVQTAYDRYWRVLTEAYAKADASGTALKEVASGSAYAQTESGLAGLRNSGQVVTGEAKHSGTSVSFKDGQQLKTAIITDCVDITQWKPVDKKTGKEVPLSPKRLLRYTTTLTAEKWPNGWVVIEEKIPGQAC